MVTITQGITAFHGRWYDRHSDIKYNINIILDTITDGYNIYSKTTTHTHTHTHRVKNTITPLKLYTHRLILTIGFTVDKLTNKQRHMIYGTHGEAAYAVLSISSIVSRTLLPIALTLYYSI